jgi:hypothetical protein
MYVIAPIVNEGEHLAQQRGALSIAEVLHEHFERLQVPDGRCPHTTCFTVHNQGPLFKNSRPTSMGVTRDKPTIVKGFRFLPQRLQYLEIHRRSFAIPGMYGSHIKCGPRAALPVKVEFVAWGKVKSPE